MYMTEQNICKEYREAKRQGIQVGILADLNMCGKEDIIRILIRNGENVTPAGPKKPGGDNDKIMQLYISMLDDEEEKIKEAERRYKNIVKSLKQYGKEGE